MENANTYGHTAIVLITVYFLVKLKLCDKAWFELLMLFTEAQRRCATAHCKKAKEDTAIITVPGSVSKIIRKD